MLFFNPIKIKIMKNILFPECNKTPSPGSRAAAVATTESLAPFPHQVYRNRGKIGALAIPDAGDRGEIRNGGGFILPLPQMVAILKSRDFATNYIVPNIAKGVASRRGDILPGT